MNPFLPYPVLAALVIATIFPACDPVRLQRGRVVDCSSHAPIGGAVVQLRDKVEHREPTLAKTDASGAYLIAVPGPNEMHQLVSAAGYREDERDVSNTRAASELRHELCLSPAR